MSRPPLEVADLIRSAGAAFIERNRQWIRWRQVKVLRAIARCRTAALGGHVDQCTRCGHRATISYNSCRNRHCPKCQTAARERWIGARQKELLPTRYVHVVFTLPASLARLALQNKKLIYGLLLRATAETLGSCRKVHRCRDPTSVSTVAHFCRMKRFSPTRILRASRRALSLCVLTQNKTPFSTSSARPPRYSLAPVCSRRLLPCSTAQSPRHSTPLSPPIQSP